MGKKAFSNPHDLRSNSNLMNKTKKWKKKRGEDRRLDTLILSTLYLYLLHNPSSATGIAEDFDEAKKEGNWDGEEALTDNDALSPYLNLMKDRGLIFELEKVKDGGAGPSFQPYAINPEVLFSPTNFAQKYRDDFKDFFGYEMSQETLWWMYEWGTNEVKTPIEDLPYILALPDPLFHSLFVKTIPNLTDFQSVSIVKHINDFRGPELVMDPDDYDYQTVLNYYKDCLITFMRGINIDLHSMDTIRVNGEVEPKPKRAPFKDPQDFIPELKSTFFKFLETLKKAKMDVKQYKSLADHKFCQMVGWPNFGKRTEILPEEGKDAFFPPDKRDFEDGWDDPTSMFIELETSKVEKLARTINLASQKNK